MILTHPPLYILDKYSQNSVYKSRVNLQEIKDLTIKLDALIKEMKKNNNFTTHLPKSSFKLNIKNEIVYILNTLQDTPQYSSKTDIESNKLREIGNLEFKNGNYQIALSHFQAALDIQGLSYLTKSILYSNLSVIYFKIGENISGNSAIINVEKSLYYRPSWWRPYLTYAKVCDNNRQRLDKSGEFTQFLTNVSQHLNPESNEIKEFELKLQNRIQIELKCTTTNHKKLFKKKRDHTSK